VLVQVEAAIAVSEDREDISLPAGEGDRVAGAERLEARRRTVSNRYRQRPDRRPG
jgi:hypothetical protein